MKRLISIILVCILLTGMVCDIPVFASVDSNNFKHRENPDHHLTENDFIKYLVAERIPIYSKEKKYKADYIIYNYYDQIVYTDRDCPFGREKGNEHEYLGYNVNNEPVGNPDFPIDADAGNDKEQWDYITVSAANNSWSKLDKERKQYVKAAALYHHGTQLGFTIDSCSNLRPINERVLIQSPPTWFSSGSIQVRHRGITGREWYATFTIEPMATGTYLDVGIDFPDGQEFSANDTGDDEYVIIPFDIWAELDLEGCAKASQIENLKVYVQSITGDGVRGIRYSHFKSEGRETDYVSKDNCRLKVKIRDLKNGANKVNITVKAECESKYGEKIEKFVTEEVTIKKGDFFASLVTTAKPSQIKLTKEELKNKKTKKKVKVKLDARGSVCSAKVDSYLFTIDGKKVYKGKNPVFETDWEVVNTSKEKSIKGGVVLNCKLGQKIALDDAIVQFYCGQPPKPSDPPPKPPKPHNYSPDIYIESKSTVYLGEPIDIKIRSYDKEGDKLEHSFSAPDDMVGKLKIGSNIVKFMSAGKKEIRAKVWDDKGGSGIATKRIMVIPPVPEANIEVIGNKKINRRVTFDASSSLADTKIAPIDWTKTKWEITLVEGIKEEDIKTKDSMKGSSSIDVLFKKAGRIKVKVYVENILGYWDDKEIYVDIANDLPPSVSLAVARTALRDKNDDKNASITVIDTTICPDGDKITKRVWFKAFDSNNDGKFKDETWSVLKKSGWKNVGVPYDKIKQTIDLENIDSVNDKEIKVKTTHVGKVKFELFALEEFDNENRILDFITFDDVLRGDTFDIDESSKTCDVVNAAPAVSATLKKAKKEEIDIVVATDYEGDKLAYLQTQLADIQRELYKNNKNVNYHFVRDKIKTGKHTTYKTVNEYARRIKLYCYLKGYFRRETDREDSRGDYDDKYYTDYINYETIYSDTEPTEDDFDKPKEIYMDFDYDYIETKSDSGTIRGRDYAIFTFYSYKNVYATQVIKKLLIFTSTERDDYYSSRDYGVEYVNWSGGDKWEKIGQRKQPIYKDVYALNMDSIKTLNLKDDSRKVLLIVSDGDSVNFSQPDSEKYAFTSLTNDLAKYITKNEFEVCTVVPSKILNLKFDRRNYNTDIKTQDISLKGLVNCCDGKILNKRNWKSSILGLKSNTEKKVVSVNSFGNEVKIKLNQNIYKDDALKITSDKGIISEMEVIGHEVGDIKLRKRCMKEHDLVVLTDYTGQRYEYLKRKMNNFKNKLKVDNIDINYHIVNDMKKVGVKTILEKVLKEYVRKIYVEFNFYEEIDDEKKDYVYFYDWEDNFIGREKNYILPIQKPSKGPRVKLSVDYEKILTDTSPSMWDFKKGRHIEHTKTYMEQEGTKYGRNYTTEYEKEYIQHHFHPYDTEYYDEDGVRLEKFLRSYWYCKDSDEGKYEGEYSYERSCHYSCFDWYDGKWWEETGYKENVYGYYDVNGVDIESMKYLDYTNSPKTLLVLAQNSGTDYTDDNLYDYSFAQFDDNMCSYIKDNGFKVFVSAPKDVHDFKGLETQKYSLKELSDMQHGKTVDDRNVDDILNSVKETIIKKEPEAYVTDAKVSGDTITLKFNVKLLPYQIAEPERIVLMDEKAALAEQCILVNEEQVEYIINYEDYEDDAKNQEKVIYTHNPNIFTNSQGIASFSGKELKEPVKVFDKVGEYRLKYKAQDRPCSDKKFSNYQKWSNICELKIKAHRKPIASLACTANDIGNWRTSKLELNISKSGYDLDHMDREDKGIASEEFKWTSTADIRWHTSIPKYLCAPKGTDFILKYRVKDIEGAYSDWDVVYLKGNESYKEIELYAKLKTLDNKFSLNSIPASEKLLCYDVRTKYPLDVSLEAALYKDEDIAAPIKKIELEENVTGMKIGSDIKWHDFEYEIPETLPDGRYIFRITAIGADGAKKEKDFDVRVRTPINLQPYVAEDIYVDSDAVVKAVTSKYVSSVKAVLFKGSKKEKTLNLKLTSSEDEKHWEKKFIVPDLKEGDYDIEFTAVTPNGNTETVTLSTKVHALKLMNLRATYVDDIKWRDYFDKIDSVPVEHLPLYIEKWHNHIKLGYIVNFKIDSIGLNDDDDKIFITMHYFAMDNHLKFYKTDLYTEENRKMIKVKDSKFDDVAFHIVLDKRSRHPYEKDPSNPVYNTWEFTLQLPSDTKAIEKGKGFFDQNIKRFDYMLLGVADIVGAKKKTRKIYDYTLNEENWGKEDGSIIGYNRNSNHNMIGKGKNHGEIIWFPLYKSCIDDLTLERRW